jgi:hypothetical protein
MVRDWSVTSIMTADVGKKMKREIQGMCCRINFLPEGGQRSATFLFPRSIFDFARFGIAGEKLLRQPIQQILTHKDNYENETFVSTFVSSRLHYHPATRGHSGHHRFRSLFRAQ